MDLQGKTVLLTGASGGIGSMIAVALARHKADLILVGRESDRLAAVRDRVLAAGGTAQTVVADLLDSQDRAALAARCAALPQGLFGLINNAGSNVFAFLPAQSEAMIQNQINLNLLAPLLLTRALLPSLQQGQGARILNIGSTFGSIGYPGYSAYCASKFGLRGFTEALRRELADSDIRVLYVAPRATATALNNDSVVALNRELGNAMDPPEQVAQQVVDAFIRGSRNQLFIGWPEKLFARINQLLPAMVDGALLKQLPVIRRYAAQHPEQHPEQQGVK